jgi:hypothetical protein
VEREAATPDAEPAAPTSGTEPAEPEGTASGTADAPAGSDDAAIRSADVVIESADPDPADAVIESADPAPVDAESADPVDGAGGSDHHGDGDGGGGDSAAPAIDADTSPEITADGRARRSAPLQPPVDGGQPESPATATGPDHRAVSASASTAGRSR